MCYVKSKGDLLLVEDSAQVVIEMFTATKIATAEDGFSWYIRVEEGIYYLGNRSMQVEADIDRYRWLIGEDLAQYNET
jgi:hypothetical protein